MLHPQNMVQTASAQQGTPNVQTTPVFEPMAFPGKTNNVGMPFQVPPVMFAKTPMPFVQQHPIQQPFAVPPIPVLQSTSSMSSVNSVSSAHTAHSDSADSPNPTAVNPAASPSPLFPQSFQPVQLVPQIPQIPQQMMMNYNGQLQPLIPVVQVQTPNGPQFQPLYYLPEQQMQGTTPPIPISGNNKFLPSPDLHPIMQKSESVSKNRSVSLSDARSVSYSHDGSEISDYSEGGKTQSLQETPIRRTRSQTSNDGYVSSTCGSECGSTSRVGDYSDVDESDKMFYTTQPSSKRQPYDSGLGQQKECNPTTQTYTASFLMQYQANGECKPCPREITPEHPTLVEHLEEEKCRNLHKYIDRLSHNKGYQVSYHSTERANNKKRPTSKERQEELYKTELCNYWINGQKCRFGKRCIFAHGQHELRMPKRKIERNRLRPPFKKQVISILNKLSESNFDTLSTELLCAAVEDVRNDESLTMVLAKALFNKAINERNYQRLYAETWRKLLNVHPMSQTLASQMMNLCLKEYSRPRSKSTGLNTMKWIAELCKKKISNSHEIVHKILGDMFLDGQKDDNVELWCKLIESLKSGVDTAKYFQQLNKLKTQFSSKIRFKIMDLEDLKKRNWVPRQ